MLDKDGNNRGFGFCEFENQASAIAAIQTLNEYEIKGKFLRVDRAEDSDVPSLEQIKQMMGQNIPQQKQPVMPNDINTHQQHLLQTQNIVATITQKVIEILGTSNVSNLFNTLVDLKNIYNQNPEQAKQILLANPPLAYSLLYTQERLGLLSPNLNKQFHTSVTTSTQIPSIQQLPQLVSPSMNVNPYSIQPNMMMPSYNQQPQIGQLNFQTLPQQLYQMPNFPNEGQREMFQQYMNYTPKT